MSERIEVDGAKPADSGRVVDEAPIVQQLRGRAAFLRDKGRIKSPEIMEHAADALESALAAQGQGEAVAEVYEGAFGVHYIGCADPSKLPVGTKLYTAPPASPAGVPDSVERCMHGCYCGCCQACKNGSCEPVKYTACDCIAAAPSAPESNT